MAVKVEVGRLPGGFRRAAGRIPSTRLSYDQRIMKLNSWEITRSRRRSVALHVNGSSRSTNTSVSSKDSTELLKKLTELDGGERPRWLSPPECEHRSKGSPLLLYLPGIDGDGLGLTLHHERLGEIFDIKCLDIPLADRTPLTELVKLVESCIRSLSEREQRKPIYLVGESFGASLALVVAAQNPDIDLVLILANPAASFSKSVLQSIVPAFSHLIQKYLHAGGLQPHAMTLMPETFTWKLKMVHEMQNYLNSNLLHVVKAQTLVLESGKNMILSNTSTEGQRLRSMLQRCDIRSFSGNKEPLFLDKNFDLVSTIKRVSYYRRGACIDYVSDFLPPTPSELKMMFEPFRWMDVAVDPVMLSTRDNGEIVRGLSGIPSEGPVILVSNHMLMAMDIVPLLSKFWMDNNLKLRGMGHPFWFERSKDGILIPEVSQFDLVRVCGGVPVSPTNLYKLLASNSHVLLYPGGKREGFHRKGEEYKLFWPKEPEFVRMAARFGAKIVPFAAVGEDDVIKLLLDGDDQMKIPLLRATIEQLNSATVRLRSDVEGEVQRQFMYYPIGLPKLPGRFYFLFGKPISTKGNKDVLTNKDKACEIYSDVQSEIEKCISYLKEKRDKDPYRNLLARLVYQARHSFDSQVPTFEI